MKKKLIRLIKKSLWDYMLHMIKSVNMINVLNMLYLKSIKNWYVGFMLIKNDYSNKHIWINLWFNLFILFKIF